MKSFSHAGLSTAFKDTVLSWISDESVGGSRPPGIVRTTTEKELHYVFQNCTGSFVTHILVVRNANLGTLLKTTLYYYSVQKYRADFQIFQKGVQKDVWGT